jgi:hypothetical protein
MVDGGCGRGVPEDDSIESQGSGVGSTINPYSTCSATAPFLG